MFESKYSNFLTVLLVVIIIGIVALVGYLGYSYYQNYYINKDAAAFVESFIEEVGKTDEEGTDTEIVDNSNVNMGEVEETPITSSDVKTYKGFTMVGTIEIPATNLKYPILEKVTKSSIETSVAVIYGPGPNKQGNTVIVGHNYRNGTFFSNNDKLVVGDKIYITDTSGEQLAYTIYDKFEATDTDTSFYTRNTNGAREVTLSTCTDDSSARIIILAKADADM
jgi:LPXTG-site transpeptidase (sortase) family protein